jgi:hypothetical protein
MRNSFWFIIIAIWVNLSLGQTPNISRDTTDFRNATWKMTKAQVKKVETDSLYSEDSDGLTYFPRLYGLDFGVVYKFVDNQLNSVFCAIMEKHSDTNQYIKDFEIIRNALVEVYGRPMTDDTSWASDKFVNKPLLWGLAVSMGQLHFETTWQTRKTSIRLVLTNGDYVCRLAISYSDRAFEKEVLERKTPDSSKETTDFRRTSWKMTKVQVKKVETDSLYHEKSDELTYRSRLSGLDCGVSYEFLDNKLNSVSCVITEKHTDENMYLRDRERIRNALVEKYGQPVLDDTLWKNDLFRNEPLHWGLAVSAGQLSFSTAWQTNNTTIILGLTGDNYMCVLGVTYSCRDLEKESLERERKRELKDY